MFPNPLPFFFPEFVCVCVCAHKCGIVCLDSVTPRHYMHIVFSLYRLSVKSFGQIRNLRGGKCQNQDNWVVPYRPGRRLQKKVGSVGVRGQQTVWLGITTNEIFRRGRALVKQADKFLGGRTLTYCNTTLSTLPAQSRCLCFFFKLKVQVTMRNP